EVAEVLDVLNLQHHLLHLDVKPDNVFLISGHAKLGDFSLVTELEGSASHDRAVGLSPQYAAPEVFLAQPSAQSDQYSLAILYAELRTGQPPFEGKSAQHLMLLHSTREPALDGLPAEEREVVARALAKDPEERFPCCKDFVKALRSAAQKRQSNA